MKSHWRQLLSRMFHIHALCSLPILLSSCAILSVDVDVYKGPLVNEEKVQLAQLLAIADGAKPLLISLRDNLEWQYTGDEIPSDVYGYKKGYIDPDQLSNSRCPLLSPFCSKGVKGFQNRLAAIVNEELGYLESATVQKHGAPQTKSFYTLNSQYLSGLSKLQSKGKHIAEQEQQDIQNSLDEATTGYTSFAARILFIANHDSLLQDQDSAGLIPGGIGNLSRGIFGDLVTETFSPFVILENLQGRGTLAHRQRTKYVRILQAVGNSILVLVNELSQQQNARMGGTLRAKTEAKAIESAFMADPFKTYMNLLHELDEEKKGQEALTSSLANHLTMLNTEMDKLSSNASKEVTADKWGEERTTAQTNYDTLLRKPTGAFQLLDSQDIDTAFEKLSGKPENIDKAWDAIYIQTKNVLRNNDLTTKAKKHLEALQKDSSLDLNLASYLEFWKSVKKKLQEERQALDDQKKLLDKLNRLLVLFKEKHETSNSKTISEKRITTLTTTHAIAKETKDKVFQKLANQDTFTTSKGVYLTLAITLQESRNSETDKTKQTDIQTALDDLNTRTPPPSFAITPNLSDAKEVLDQELALLRQEHIQAVRAGGTGAESVGKALAAIETALQYRAGMVRLRPTSAYLRTSYPSTSLQDDPNLAWDNLLLQQGLRDIPFSSYLAELFNPNKKHDETITAELDKQYWQNINRVRVSGVGTTNYVLAKDDVGNWYVKHYSGDTGQIFESARKLGMFNLAGAGAKASLLASLNKQIGPNDESPSASQSTPLQRVFDRHRTAYETQTKADLTTLHDLTIGHGLRTAIRDGWKPLFSDPNEPTETTLTTLLNAPTTQLTESITKIERDDKTRPGVKAVQGLQAVHSFHRAVRINIENLPTSQMNTDTKKSALKTLAHTIQDKLSSFTDNRQHLIQEYEQAIIFIGDATDQSNGPAKGSQ